jgi:hypothetical protein
MRITNAQAVWCVLQSRILLQVQPVVVSALSFSGQEHLLDGLRDRSCWREVVIRIR